LSTKVKSVGMVASRYIMTPEMIIS